MSVVEDGYVEDEERLCKLMDKKKGMEEKELFIYLLVTAYI